MPWSQTTPMDQKTQFIADYLREIFSFAELCARYGVSRDTGYRLVERYLEQGPAGLEARSRRPHTSPNETSPHIVEALLELRRRHPRWGAKKLLLLLGKRHPSWDLPARTTVFEILNRHGMVPKKRRRRSIGHPGRPTTRVFAPNDLWCADFKGEFKTGDGIYCYPLTVTDEHSRYLLGCQGLLSTKVIEAKPVFTRLFKEYGLPKRIRTDIPHPVVDLLQPHVLADAHGGDVDPGVLLPADAAVGAHVAHLEPIGILERRELRRHLPWRELVTGGRRVHVQRLVRPLLVELLPEVVELALLRPATARWRARRLGLERAVHALVTPVLLRLARLDELGQHPKAHPPGRELRQARQGVGREGHSVLSGRGDS
jgi:transposase